MNLAELATKNPDVSTLKKLIGDKRRAARAPEDIFFRVYHVFMTSYGWIPLDEFSRLPLVVVLSLFKEIKSDSDALKARVPKK